ncbi:COQ9 family protein [Sphingomonas sp. XMGL2]|uniref:COQ9 family protein n=1 Tax=Sphingomonas quercus TaxID=2842451 RepID=A0ABS6BGR0_9SPHN|nr:COQ9 family protein [Sphingomonas quercus]MBU3077006.1 COQ9 family protein [Sphingomonas quercus]
MTLPVDPTLDEMRDALAAVIPAHAAFDGWTEEALGRAAEELGLAPAQARLAFPGGAIDMIDAWYGWIDAEMARRLPPERLAAMRFRDRIAALVMTRLDLSLPYREAARRALNLLANPRHLPRAARLGWRAADAMWRLAGDTATDFNHYTKRMTLSAVYAQAILVWLDDESEHQAETRAFLDRRIAGVMRFEKLKAGLRRDPERRFKVARFLGRLRYPPK